MTLASAATSLEGLSVLTELPVVHIADMTVELEPFTQVPTLVGDRLVAVAKRGRLQGPRISAELLPGGGDAMVLGSDGIARVNAHAVFKTDDGVLIDYSAGGVAKFPADGSARLAAGEALPFGETYIRTTPKFETADERYTWLNALVSVSFSLLSSTRTQARIYAVL
jgi:hypothetical protein